MGLTHPEWGIETPSPLPARAWGGTGRTEGFRFREGGRGAFVRYLPAMAFVASGLLSDR